ARPNDQAIKKIKFLDSFECSPPRKSLGTGVIVCSTFGSLYTVGSATTPCSCCCSHRAVLPVTNASPSGRCASGPRPAQSFGVVTTAERENPWSRCVQNARRSRRKRVCKRPCRPTPSVGGTSVPSAHGDRDNNVPTG
ncbi:hypothetical protein FWK35_00011803, partial [Aphis craccivora]